MDFRSHRYTCVFTLLAVILGGCALIPIKTVSPVTGQKVTRAQLQGEAEAAAARFAAAGRDIDDKEARRDAFMNIVATVIKSAVPPGYGDMATSLLAAAGVGATIDNIRVRRNVAKSTETPPETPAV